MNNTNWEQSACLFCDVISGDVSVPFRGLFPSRSLSDQILLQTTSFIVIPDIAPIVEGYLLIVAKNHVPSMSHLHLDKLYELQQIKKTVQVTLNKLYGSSIVFEHGESTFSRNAGACIDHAHLHIVPTDIDLYSSFQEFNFEDIDSIISLNKFSRDTGYLLYENQTGELSIAFTDQCEQQYFRRKLTFAEKIKVPWNWRDYIRYADVLNTRVYIENCIAKVSTPLLEAWTKYRE